MVSHSARASGMRAWTFSGLILEGVLSTAQGRGGTDTARSVAAVAEPAAAAQNPADGSTVLPLGVATTAAANASVSRWNSRALDLCVKYRRNPLRIARALAVLHAGIQDAVASAAATT